MKNVTTLLLGLSVVLAGACKDTAGLTDNASVADRADILASVDGSGYAGQDYGTTDPESNFSAAQLDGATAASEGVTTAGTVILPALWGIRHGRPTAVNRTVNITNDTARVNVVVEFEGTFMMIVPQIGAGAQTITKPAVGTMTQNLVLVKKDSAEDGEDAEDDGDRSGSGHGPTVARLGGRRWMVIQVSPQNWQMKDEAKRTTKVTSVRVVVNGVEKINVTDPAQLYDVNHKMPRLHRGDVVQVFAEVSNSANTGNTPPTFAFLHVMHADPSGLGWRRLQMQQTGDGQFQLSWVVRMSGRDRLVVTALDSQSFQTDAATDFRGNAWAVPYRIE